MCFVFYHQSEPGGNWSGPPGLDDPQVFRIEIREVFCVGRRKCDFDSFLSRSGSEIEEKLIEFSEMGSFSRKFLSEFLLSISWGEFEI